MSVMVEHNESIKELILYNDDRINLYKGRKIIPYKEAVEMGHVVWFDIVLNGEVIEKINSKYVMRIIDDLDKSITTN